MPVKQLLKKFFLNFLKFNFFLFLIFSFFVLITKVYDFLLIKNIVINTDKKENILGLDEVKKRNILFLNEDKIKKQLLIKNSEFKDILIKKKYPDTLIIDIVFDNPIAVLVSNNGYFYVNENGKVLNKIKNNNEKTLPFINFYQKLNFQNYYPGKIIEFKEIVLALRLLKKMNDLNIKVNSLDINGVGVILFNLEDKRVFFSTEKNIDTQWYQFERIFRQFKIEGKNYKEIDLRFDKPIVRF